MTNVTNLTNQHQRLYAIDNSPIQNPFLQRSCKSNFPSHTQKRKTLTYPYNNAEKPPGIDFFYADIQGNLKHRLKNAINNKLVYSFRDKGELLHLFEKFGWDLDNFDGESVDRSTGGNEQQD